eukprot:scaffold65433_cov66-Phaeocystis_antarctica.AAC.9
MSRGQDWSCGCAPADVCSPLPSGAAAGPGRLSWARGSRSTPPRPRGRTASRVAACPPEHTTQQASGAHVEEARTVGEHELLDDAAARAALAALEDGPRQHNHLGAVQEGPPIERSDRVDRRLDHQHAGVAQQRHQRRKAVRPSQVAQRPYRLHPHRLAAILELRDQQRMHRELIGRRRRRRHVDRAWRKAARRRAPASACPSRLPRA